MRSIHSHLVFALLSLVVLSAACSRPVASIEPAASVPASSAASTAIPSAASALSAAPATPDTLPQASLPPTQVASNLTKDTVAVTVVDRLRVRSWPRVSDDSTKFKHLLPVGTDMYVLDGPVLASGYSWYEVAPLSSRSLPAGWVASASPDGEPWIEAGSFECPPVPTDFRSLVALPSAVGLACFPRVPINVMARLMECNCAGGVGWLTPEWFIGGVAPAGMLVEPGMSGPPANVRDGIWLNLDPAGQHPEVLPMGEVVEVTGIFDHPAAASCAFHDMLAGPEPSGRCRLAFAVTSLGTILP